LNTGGIMAHKRATEDAVARARDIEKKYQEAIMRSQENRAEILKGLRRKDALEDLFLKALETIYLMTGDEAFYKQAEECLRQYR